ncbi:MAG: hypothetical protein M3018_01290 [Actinomycetota bacterium]|nr:hypothetical protein [Actinomycetota bacterium]
MQMFRRLVKLAGAILPVLIGGLLLTAAPSVGAGPGNLGNGPKHRLKAPNKVTLPRGRALILVQFVNGKITNVSGTAVPRSQRRSTLGAPRLKSANCNVNFTHNRARLGNQTVISWYGGVGCSRQMIIFGQAFLLQNASRVDAKGTHYEGYLRSAASGFGRTFVNAPNPSLYIRHLVNVNFLDSGGTGSIVVFPSPGQLINGASVCGVSTVRKYGIGVSCDLYSNRF